MSYRTYLFQVALSRNQASQRHFVTTMGTATAQRRGAWEPLPLIVYGYAVHPLTPCKRDTRISNRRPMSTITEVSDGDIGGHRDVVSLEVGDEVYAFEKYTPRGKEVEGVWYRGCVDPRPLPRHHTQLPLLAMSSVPHVVPRPCPGPIPPRPPRPPSEPTNRSKSSSAYSPHLTSMLGTSYPTRKVVCLI